jgi:hypothetical protein
MNSFLMTAYILIWPAASAAILLALLVALIRDMRAAK